MDEEKSSSRRKKKHQSQRRRGRGLMDSSVGYPWSRAVEMVVWFSFSLKNFSMRTFLQIVRSMFCHAPVIADCVTCSLQKAFFKVTLA